MVGALLVALGEGEASTWAAESGAKVGDADVDDGARAEEEDDEEEEEGNCVEEVVECVEDV